MLLLLLQLGLFTNERPKRRIFYFLFSTFLSGCSAHLPGRLYACTSEPVAAKIEIRYWDKHLGYYI